MVYSAPVVLLPEALYDPESDRLYKDTAVRIENGKIAALLPVGECPDEERVELPGLTLLPGLIDAHLHLCLRGAAREMERLPRLSREDLRAVLEENLKKNLAKGITTVRDLGCPAEMVRLIAERRPAVPAPGIVTSGPALTVPGGHGVCFGLPLRDKKEIPAALDTLDELGTDLVKIMATGGNSTPGTDVDACQFPDDFFAEMVSQAHRRGKKVACHVHGLAGVWQCIRAGADSIEHGSYMDAAAQDAMAQAGIAYVATVCPGKLLPDLPPAAADRVARRHALIRRGVETGVNFAAGTDAGIPGVPHGSLVQEIQELARLGLGARGALRAATWNNAQLLGLSGCGRIAPGCAADFAAYRGDIINNLDLLEHPAFVMRAGECVVWEGEWMPDAGQ